MLVIYISTVATICQKAADLVCEDLLASCPQKPRFVTTLTNSLSLVFPPERNDELVPVSFSHMFQSGIIFAKRGTELCLVCPN